MHANDDAGDSKSRVYFNVNADDGKRKVYVDANADDGEDVSTTSLVLVPTTMTRRNKV